MTRKIIAGSCFSLLVALLLTGCSLSMGPSANDILSGMGRVPDSTIVKDGLPTYIIMIESMLSKAPDDPKLLEAAAQLYSLYGAYFVDDQERARSLTARALEYALTSSAKIIPGMVSARSSSYADFETVVKNTSVKDVATLFSTGSVWLDWVRVRKDDLDAVADLPMIQLMMQRVTELEADYRSGMATLYLALLASMEYGDDQSVRDYFNRAVEQAAGKNLMPQVFYGIWLTNNGEVEAGCVKLKKVIQSGLPVSDQFTLMNDFALKQAKQTIDKLGQTGSCQPGLEKGK